MTTRQIENLKGGEILSNGRGRWIEVADTSRLNQFGDIEAWTLEPNETGDLVRADWDTILLTVNELKKFN